MMPDKKVYTGKDILSLVAAVHGNEEAFQWLMANGRKEFGALCDLLAFDATDALDWLKQNHYTVLAAFYGALQEEDGAAAYLMQHNAKEWAATADAVNGNDSAVDWLEKYHPVYAQLADGLIRRTYFGGGGGYSGSGGYGGGGFGGFGGGSFGGGGGGGKW